jgi:probable phosphoglycerate mutase
MYLMKRLFYIRHGQTIANINNIFGGHSETSLSELGKNQAKKAGVDAKTNLPKIDVIISSPLSRAYDTAKLVAKEIEYPIDRIELNPLFVERSYGELEGTSIKDFFATHNPDEVDSIHGAETVEHLRQRATKALEYLRLRNEDNILVVSHGAFGNAFISEIKMLPYSYGSFDDEPKNGEITELI